LLARAGFDVTLKTDVGRDALRQAAKEFGAMARGSEAREVFFYYAGHGVQMNWRNFLIPVDERIETRPICRRNASNSGAAQRSVQSERQGLHPDPGRLSRQSVRNRFQPAEKGLSQFDAPAGSLLAFSTSPGSVAIDSRTSDRNAVNGLYAGHLIRELSVQGSRLEDALKRVRLSCGSRRAGCRCLGNRRRWRAMCFSFPTASTKLTEGELEAEFQREIATWNRIKGRSSRKIGLPICAIIRAGSSPRSR
jgi:uncharacterized caspase-like protein